MILQKNTFWCLTILLMVSYLCSSCSDNQTVRPNIVLLFCDDMGYGDLGSFGHPTIRTPNLDKMAADGVKFTNFYSGSPACTASRYALLTGRYPVNSGFSWVLYPYSSRGIHAREITLAEGMKEEGYATGCFGKWHLGTTQKSFLPLQNGFDEYLGLPYSNDMLPPNHPDIALMDGNDTLEMNPDQSTLTKRYTERAISFIEKNNSQPFFCYLPYAMPHVPLHPGEQFAGKSARGTYGDVVEEIDWSVGQILKYLRENGLAENTLVFFTSDNGPWIIKNERGGSAGLLRDGKGSTWEGGMRVPGIAYFAGKTKAGKVVDSPASTLDLYTTFLEMAGHEFPADQPINGEDIRDLIFGEDTRQMHLPYFYYGPRQLHAVRKGKWKLHVKTSSQTGKDYFDGKLPLLFNLDTDPSEKYDLSDTHPEIVADLQGEIDRQLEYVEKHPDFYQQARDSSKINHLALGKTVLLKNKPDEKYNHPGSLTDGFLESSDAFGKLAGFNGTDFEATVDLGLKQSVTEISIGFFQVPRSWIFLPGNISFSTSVDGVHFVEQQSVAVPAAEASSKEKVEYFKKEIESTPARFIKIIASNPPCPAWHEGKGRNCWLFADEIVVK